MHPDWRRRGLGTALLRWVEERQARVAATHPAGVERRLQSWANESEAGRIALLEAHGYGIVRYDYEMERPNLDDIPELPLPEGIELRPAREEDLRRFLETEVEVFRDHWGAIDDSEAAFEQMRADPRRDIRLWVVAWQGDEIVGQVLNRIDREANAELGLKRGWVNSVGVRGAVAPARDRPRTRGREPARPARRRHDHGRPGRRRGERRTGRWASTSRSGSRWCGPGGSTASRSSGRSTPSAAPARGPRGRSPRSAR